MIIGRVLRTLKEFLGQNNQSYWPHSRDNTLSPCFSLSVFHSHTPSEVFLRVSKCEAEEKLKKNILVQSFMESICVQFQHKVLLC